jgi:glycosyltransferase involved in cell wall biosynthesis
MNKVLIVSLFPISATGGGENYTLNCAKSVSIKDFKCDLASPSESQFVVDRSVGRFHTYFNKVSLNAGKIDSEKVQKFSEILNQVSDYDFIWIHQYLGGIAIYDLMLVTHNNQNIIFTNLGFEENSIDFWIRYRPLPNHFFIEISDYASERTKKHTKNVSYVYAGAWKKQLVKELPVNISHKNKFVSVGRILPHKSFEVAIDALPVEESLVVIGPYGEPSYKDYLTMKSRSKNVYMTGEIIASERDSIIATSKALIANSSYRTYRNHKFEQSELLGLVIIEALLNGTLPITSSQAALKEVMTALGLTDFIYPERDAIYLRKLIKIVQSLSDSEYISLISKAKQIIINEFLWDNYWIRVKEKVCSLSDGQEVSRKHENIIHFEHISSSR